MEDKMYTLEEYVSLRKQMVEENENLVGVVLNEDEKKVDQLINKLKKEFKDGCGDFVPYNMPMLKDDRIKNSELYKVLYNLPKGCDLHVHGSSLVPVHYMLDFLIEHENMLIDIDTLILTTKKSDRAYPIGEAINKGLLTRDQIIKKWTILGLKEGEDAWLYFEKLFDYTAALDEDKQLLKDYYVFAFEYYVKLNIFHVEIHVLLSSDMKKTEDAINIIKEAYHEVKRKDERFSVSLIGASMKMFETMEETREIIECALNAHINILDDYYPDNPCDFILGMDLINEEDRSRPLREYAGLLIEYKAKHPDFEYYLHCGESINAENDNLIDAFLLKVERVGHGTNLYRYPKLLSQYANNEICLESCLISNQVLDYVKDLRLHPSAEYLKRGVMISLCSDDPIFFENETLVDDFFAATICWNLGLAEIKQLCINSLMYSGLSETPKRKLMKDWTKAYHQFIELYSK